MQASTMTAHRRRTPSYGGVVLQVRGTTVSHIVMLSLPAVWLVTVVPMRHAGNKDAAEAAAPYDHMGTDGA